MVPVLLPDFHCFYLKTSVTVGMRFERMRFERIRFDDVSRLADTVKMKRMNTKT